MQTHTQETEVERKKDQKKIIANFSSWIRLTFFFISFHFVFFVQWIVTSLYRSFVTPLEIIQSNQRLFFFHWISAHWIFCSFCGKKPCDLCSSVCRFKTEWSNRGERRCKRIQREKERERNITNRRKKNDKICGDFFALHLDHDTQRFLYEVFAGLN